MYSNLYIKIFEKMKADEHLNDNGISNNFSFIDVRTVDDGILMMFEFGHLENY